MADSFINPSPVHGENRIAQLFEKGRCANCKRRLTIVADLNQASRERVIRKDIYGRPHQAKFTGRKGAGEGSSRIQGRISRTSVHVPRVARSAGNEDRSIETTNAVG
jgi:hypothetical protein